MPAAQKRPWQQRSPAAPQWVQRLLPSQIALLLPQTLLAQQRWSVPPQARQVPLTSMVYGAVQATSPAQAGWLSLPQAPAAQPPAEHSPARLQLFFELDGHDYRA